MRELRNHDPGTILLRRPRTGQAGFVEEVVERMRESTFMPRYTVEWFSPDSGGRDQTYRRDFELVESADEVLAVFHPDHVMSGGTGHVVEAALLRGIPVSAWVAHEDGRFERVGEQDRVVG